jgi:aerobic C4-dicarboxylate transport protein
MHILGKLYVQVLIGIVLGVLVGILWPRLGTDLKPLGDAFIKLIRMVVAPVIFCTVALGIAHMRDVAKFGRVGGKAILYFEVVSTLALVIGIAVAELVRPGDGFGIDPASLDPSVAASYVSRAKADSITDHLMNIIPDTFLGAFANGDLLQVVFIAILFGFACSRLGAVGEKAAGVLQIAVKIFFSIIHIVVRFAPLGAFGAMAFTIGRYGIGSLVQLGWLVGSFYITAFLFVMIVLNIVARFVGFSLWRFLVYIREELLIVLGASSSESALPQLMEKLERLGASPGVVGLVVPTGYSFNLDGTNIYLTLAILFLAQATGVHLSAGEMALMLLVAMVTSKGASGVTGAGFVTLAATLAAVPDIPIAALAILVGVDRFMSECRSITNFIGNGVATLAVAAWEKELDFARLRKELSQGPGSAENARDSERMLAGVKS